MHSWCSSYLEKRPLGKFGRDETKFKLPLHHLFLILQVHIILGAALDLKWGGLGDLCTWGKNKESELPPNFIIVFTHWRCQSLENFEGFQLFLFYFKESLQGSREKNEYFAVRLTISPSWWVFARGRPPLDDHLHFLLFNFASPSQFVLRLVQIENETRSFCFPQQIPIRACEEIVAIAQRENSENTKPVLSSLIGVLPKNFETIVA